MSEEGWHFENVSAAKVPKSSLFKQWAYAALSSTGQAEKPLSLRVVDSAEMREINRRYRQQDKATNVLSFPFNPLVEAQSELTWGDLLICAPLVLQQAREQNKRAHAHWAHLTVHGTLHLLGFDHIEDEQAIIMETQEIAIMRTLGFDNPYLPA